MEARAVSRYNRQSPQKVRLVVDLIRGRSVNDAYAVLQYTKKRAATAVTKTLRSAVANARDKAEQQGELVDVDELYVKEAFVDEGPYYKRWRAAAMGRPARIRRPTAHVTVVVDRKE
jgi:large subunit ribosomal protein L22